MNNQQLMAMIEKAISTGSLSNGLMNPEQSKAFHRMVFEATPFSQLHRKEQRKAKNGEIDKIAIGGRLLRKKVENTDDGYRAGITTSAVPYNAQAVRLPWEITEETLRQNIEGENFEDTVMQMMTKQVGIDLEDLHFNGDTTSADSFLSINDGWVKQIRTGTGSHVIDHTAVGAGFGKATLFAVTRAMPNRYKNQNLRWLMSPTRREMWVEYLTNRPTGAGDAALLGVGDQVNRPLGYGIVEIPSLADDIIILSDPQNFISVWTYEIRIRKTDQGKEAVMQDKRFYVVHFDDDPIIQELDAVVMLENLPATLATA